MKRELRPVYLDGDSLAKQCINATAADDLKAGITPTGGVFGTLRSLVALYRNSLHRMGHITVFFDQGVPQYRRDLLPEYKANRASRREKWTEEERERIYLQMDIIRDLCQILGMTVIRRPEWEADDGIAHAVYNSPPGSLVITGDRDNFQACAVGAEVLYIKDGTTVTKDNFQDVMGVPCDHYFLYKVLVGKADHHAGAGGCGEVRAVEAWRMLADAGIHETDTHAQLNALARLILRIPSAKRTKWQQAILVSRPRLHSVIDAVGFAEAAARYEPITERGTGVVDKDALLAFLKKYKFNSLLSQIPTIVQCFTKAPT